MVLPLLKEALHSTRHLIFPQLCEGCRTPLLYAERVLCMGCNFQMPRTDFHGNPGNETATRIAGRIAYQHATSFAYFTADGLLQHLLHRLKYAGRQNIGLYLGQQTGYALSTADWAANIEAVIPIPLHPKKEAMRGYNQSALIAAGIAAILKVPVYEHALVRMRHTESQTRMTREERVVNVKDAFVRSGKQLVPERHLLLVDDVLTTGATLEAAAHALLCEPGTRLSICTVGLAKD